MLNNRHSESINVTGFNILNKSHIGEKKLKHKKVDKRMDRK